MGHYDSFYESEAQDNEKRAKEAALKEFENRYTPMIKDMVSDDIEAINYFIHWYKELKKGLRVIRSIYNKLK